MRERPHDRHNERGMVVLRAQQQIPGSLHRYRPEDSSSSSLAARDSVQNLIKSISRMGDLQDKLIVVDEHFVNAEEEPDFRSALFSIQRHLTQTQSFLSGEVERFKQRCDQFQLQRQTIFEAFQLMHSCEFQGLQQLNSDLVRLQITATAQEQLLENEMRRIRDELATVQAAISAADRRQSSHSVQIRLWKQQANTHNQEIRKLLSEEERRAYHHVNDLDEELRRVPEQLQEMQRALAEAEHQANMLSLDKSRMEELLVESIVESAAEHYDGIEGFAELIEKHMGEKAPWLARQVKRTMWFATLPISVSINVMKAVRERIS